MSDNAFCLDIGEKFIRVVDSKLKGNLIEVQTYGQADAMPFYYNGGSDKNIESQADIIRELVTTLKIKKRNVNVIIPDSFSYSQIIDVPRLNDKELQSAIRYQADQFIPMPLDDISLDLEIIKEDVKNKQNTILLIASPKKVVSQLEKTLEYAGLNPVSLENEFSAIRRFYIEIGKFIAPSVLLLVNIGYTTSSIYLIDQISSVSFSRTIKIGLDIFIKDVKLNLNIDEKKALEILQQIGFEKNASINLQPYVQTILSELIGEINKFIILAKDKYNISLSQVILLNYNSLIMSLEKEIQTSLGIPTQSLTMENFLVKNSISSAFNGVSSSYISALVGGIR